MALAFINAPRRTAKKAVAVALIASALFFTPFSVSLSVSFTRAETGATTTEGTIDTTAITDGTTANGESGGGTQPAQPEQKDDPAPTNASTTEAGTQASGPSTTPDMLGDTANDAASTTGAAPGSATTTATTTDAAGPAAGEQASTTASQAPGLAGAEGEGSESGAVTTGDAVANASLLNVVNTNLVNSVGELLSLRDLFLSSTDQFDLRRLGFFSGAAPGAANPSSLDVANAGDASTTNAVSAHATTGGNAVATDGEAAVSTGNAYAAGNAINLANNNFVDSKYLFMTYNGFGDSAGDVVFPNADTFLRLLASGHAASGTAVLSSSTGLASIENGIGLSADSGSNEFLSTCGPGAIATGKSSTLATVLNRLNSNYIGGSSLNVHVNVHGEWSGKVFGLPPGVRMERTTRGFTLSYETFEELAEPALATTTVSNAASTTIVNSFDVSASSGGNAALGCGGSIATGASYAAANVINVANTNLIGHNMFDAILNIYGDWSGDMTFGKPDLWVGGHADIAGSALYRGQEVRYSFTVINNGDLAADNVRLAVDLGSPYLNSQTGGNPRNIVITVGALKPNESKTVGLTAVLDGSAPITREMVTTVAKATSDIKDFNPNDDVERISLVLAKKNGRSRNSRIAEAEGAIATTTAASAPAPQVIKVRKSFAGPSFIHASSAVDYKVVIENTSSSTLYGARMFDRLTASDGRVIDSEVWNIGTLRPRESVIVTYTVFFKGTSPSGFYGNSAYVSASLSATSSVPTISNVALATVRVIGAERQVPLKKSDLKPVSVRIEAATSTPADSAEGGGDESLGPNVAHAAGSESMLAGAYHSTPTARQLAIVMASLIAVVLALIGLRRKGLIG